MVLRKAPTNKATRPFYCMHINLFPEIIAYNGYVWTIYFYNKFLQINKVETFAHKLLLTQVIKQYLNRVKRQYN